LVFSYLELLIQSETAKPLVQNKAKQSQQEGQSVFLQLNAQFKGEDAKPHNILDAEIKVGKLSWNTLPNFTPEKFTSTLTKYFNTLEENGEEWSDLKNIRAMVQFICWDNSDMIWNSPWTHNVRDILQNNWSKWEFSKAVEFYNSKAWINKKSKCSVSSINGKKGRGNKSKKSRSESASTDSNNSNICLQAQKLRGYKLNGKPTKNIIEGPDISPVLTFQ